MTLFQNSVLCNYLQNIDKISKKLEAFYTYDFETSQKELLELQSQIDITDKQLDEMAVVEKG